MQLLSNSCKGMLLWPKMLITLEIVMVVKVTMLVVV